jgi:cytochrome c
MACHTIIPDALDKEGPNLFGVYGQRFGQNRHGYPYTSALIAAGGRWDAATLNAWMANPKRIVPETTMQFAGVSDPLDRADVIAYLQSQTASASGGARE